jgi:hypothetical protein
LRGKIKKNMKMIKKKRATIKRISTIFNIKTKQNQMENEKIGKKILKKIQNKERSIKKKEDPN